MIVQRTHPSEIPSGKDLLGVAVPHDKGKIAQQVRGAVRRPLLIGMQDELSVWYRGTRLGRQTQGATQLIAIV